MRKSKQAAGIQWAVAGGFLLIMTFSWVVEFIGSFRTVNGHTEVFDWWESITQSLIVLVVAIPVMALLRRLLSRLYYLEGFLCVCAWCKRVDNAGEWISMDEFLTRNFQTETSHGICGPCADELKKQQI